MHIVAINATCFFYGIGMVGFAMRDKVIEAIRKYGEGGTTRSIFADLRLSPGDFYGALDQYPDLAAAYERARKMRADVWADDIIAIADDVSLHALHARNRIDARKWLASKMFPKTYGDRIDLNVEGRVDLVAAIAEGSARALPAPLRNPDQITDATFEVISPSQPEHATDKQSVERAEPTPVDPFAD